VSSVALASLIELAKLRNPIDIIGKIRKRNEFLQM
jgi:hypothetical protein